MAGHVLGTLTMNFYKHPGGIGANNSQIITRIARVQKQKCPELPVLHFGSILLFSPHRLGFLGIFPPK